MAARRPSASGTRSTTPTRCRSPPPRSSRCVTATRRRCGWSSTARPRLRTSVRRSAGSGDVAARCRHGRGAGGAGTGGRDRPGRGPDVGARRRLSGRSAVGRLPQASCPRAWTSAPRSSAPATPVIVVDGDRDRRPPASGGRTAVDGRRTGRPRGVPDRRADRREWSTSRSGDRATIELDADWSSSSNGPSSTGGSSRRPGIERLGFDLAAEVRSTVRPQDAIVESVRSRVVCPRRAGAGVDPDPCRPAAALHRPDVRAGARPVGRLPRPRRRARAQQHRVAARDQPGVHRGVPRRAQPRDEPRAALARVPGRSSPDVVPTVLRHRRSAGERRRPPDRRLDRRRGPSARSTAVGKAPRAGRC